MVALIAVVTVGSMGLAVAQTSNTVYVDPADTTADDNTYTTIQTAVNNSVENGTIKVVSGTYSENINLTVNNLTIESNSTNHVTIDGAINATENENVTEVHIGDNVTVVDGVMLQAGGGGGGISIGAGTDLLNDKLYGVPLALWGLLVLVVAYVGYIEYYQD